jgi:hypothetical protein
MSLPISKQRSGPGCFTYGCLIAIVLFSLAIGGIWFYAKRSIGTAVDKYTANTGIALKDISVDSVVVREGVTKFFQLQDALNARAPIALSFTSAELQGLVSTTPWRDWVRVDLGANNLSAQFSIPLAALGDWYAASFVVGKVKDRFLTGSSQCQVSIRDGALKVSFSELVLNGEQLEDMPRGHAAEYVVGAINEMGAENDSKLSLLKRFKSLEVVDGKLVVEVVG